MPHRKLTKKLAPEYSNATIRGPVIITFGNKINYRHMNALCAILIFFVFMICISGCKKRPDGIYSNSDYIVGMATEQTFDFRRDGTVHSTTILGTLPAESGYGTYSVNDNSTITATVTALGKSKGVSYTFRWEGEDLINQNDSRYRKK